MKLNLLCLPQETASKWPRYLTRDSKRREVDSAFGSSQRKKPET